MTVMVLEVFMHNQSLKIQTHLCWKFEVRVRVKISNGKILEWLIFRI